MVILHNCIIFAVCCHSVKFAQLPFRLLDHNTCEVHL